MPETALTSALNAAIITGNGNEGLLQNDMGNTLIKDSITGGIMSLNDGFVPVGMKEHGGILYIASYNPETKEGELGSIPSPIIHYSDIEKEINSKDIVLIEKEIPGVIKFDFLSDCLNKNLIYLGDTIFRCGDKFMISLNLNLDKIKDIVSSIDQKNFFKINLFAITDSGKEILLDSVINKKQQYFDLNNTLQTSDYWFIQESSSIDLEKTKVNNLLRTYPNIKPGRLAIRIEQEYPSEIEYLYNESYGANFPNIYTVSEIETDATIHTTWVIFNGFQYKSDCSITIAGFEISVNNGEFPLYKLRSDGTKIIADKFENQQYRFGKKNASGNGDFYITNDENTYYISANGEKSVRNDKDHIYGLFAIKIQNQNTNIDVAITPYVSYEGRLLKYRDNPEQLPRFNPALALLGNEGYSLDISKSDLWYQFAYNQEHPEELDQDKTFDIELFKDSEYKCFLKTGDNDILKFDESKHKYIKNTSISAQDCLSAKTYIYPGYVIGTNNSTDRQIDYRPNFIWMYEESKHWDETHEAKRYCPEDKYFIKSSILPTVKGYTVDNNGNTIDQVKTRNLLLPIDRSNLSHTDLTAAFNSQKEDFLKQKNKLGLTPDGMKKYCLFGVNLNIINNSVNDALFNGYRAFVYGEDNSSQNALKASDGVETFWRYQDKTDKSLAVYGSENESYEKFKILLEDGQKQQALKNTDVPNIFIKGNNDKIATDTSYGRFYENDEIVRVHPYITNDLDAGTYGLNHGFLNTITRQCPGFFSAKNPISFDLNFIDYKYSSQYLYKDPIDFKIVNNGNKYIKYLNAFYHCRYSMNTLYFDLLKRADNFNIILKYKLNTQDVDTQEIYDNHGEDCGTFKDIQFDLLEKDIYCKLPIESNYLQLNFQAICKNTSEENTVTSQDDNSTYFNISDERILVMSPSFFVEPLNLTRKYVSDYKIINQVGYKQTGDSKIGYNTQGGLALSNIVVTKNYLYNNDFVGTEEFLTSEIVTSKLVSHIKSPDEFSTNKQENSFCNIKGFLELTNTGYTTIVDKNISLEKGWYILNVNSYSSKNKVKFKVTIDSKEFEFTNYVAFYVSSSGQKGIKLEYKLTQNEGVNYIKNIGVYKIDPEKVEDFDKWPEDKLYLPDKLYNAIILPSVFCYKECLNNGEELGCMDKKFSGFVHLPNRSYERCVGLYCLGTNQNNEYKNASIIKESLDSRIKEIDGAIQIQNMEIKLKREDA